MYASAIDLSIDIDHKFSLLIRRGKNQSSECVVIIASLLISTCSFRAVKTKIRMLYLVSLDENLDFSCCNLHSQIYMM